MKDARGEAKAERHNSDQATQCVVCGRWFSKRKDTVCSKKCAERLDESAEGGPTPWGHLSLMARDVVPSGSDLTLYRAKKIGVPKIWSPAPKDF